MRKYSGIAAMLAAITWIALSASASGASTARALAHSATKQKSSTLVLVNSQQPPSLDPAIGGIRDPNDYWDDLAYAPLIYTLPNGLTVGGIATKWGYVGKGNKEFALTLRPNARCSDGTTLTAADVAANFAYWVKAGGPWAYVAANFASVRANSKLHLVITLKQRDPNLVSEFTEGYATGDVICPSGVKNPTSLGTATDGAGAYKLDPSATVTGQTYTYVQNPYYWDKASLKFKKVVIKIIANPTAQLAALQAGEADYVNGTPTTAAAAKHAGFQVDTAPIGVFELRIKDRDGATVKALGNPLVREALSLAVNRPALTKAVFGAYGTPADQFAIPGAQGYSATLNGKFAYNPTKAKKLLAQAGYPNGFTFSLFIFPTSPPEATAAQALAAEWSAIGVTAQIVVPTSTAEFVGDINDATHPAYLFQDVTEPMLGNYGSLWSTPADPYHVSDPTLNKLAAEAQQATTTAAAPLYVKMNARVQQLGWDPVFSDYDTIIYARPGLQGWQLNGAYSDPDPVFFTTS